MCFHLLQYLHRHYNIISDAKYKNINTLETVMVPFSLEFRNEQMIISNYPTIKVERLTCCNFSQFYLALWIYDWITSLWVSLFARYAGRWQKENSGSFHLNIYACFFFIELLFQFQICFWLSTKRLEFSLSPKHKEHMERAHSNLQ